MKIGIVLVTFNRLSHLEKTIRLYEQQTRLPEYILVVDNHSTDGTAEFLANWAKENSPIQHKLITLPQNIGGSGGFHAGTEAASKLDADWIWLADDDAYPDKNALEELEHFSKRNSKLMENVSALCTENYGRDGILATHRARVQRTPFGTRLVPVSKEEYGKEYFSLEGYSFVGAMVKKEKLLKAGLPNKDFFIYADDTEHSLRMQKVGEIICVPAAKVYHNDNYGNPKEISWRDYYAVRNILLTIKWNYGMKSYFATSISRLFSAIFSGNVEKLKVYWTAICDAWKDKVGIHEIYHPGWKPEK